jgi:hypothetical protein
MPYMARAWVLLQALLLIDVQAIDIALWGGLLEEKPPAMVAASCFIA